MQKILNLDIESNEYYFLSNNYPSPFNAPIDNQTNVLWRNVSTFLAAMKISDINERYQIQNTYSDNDLQHLVDTLTSNISDNWNRDEYLDIALFNKFQANARLRKKLLNLSKYTFVSKTDPVLASSYNKLITKLLKTKVVTNDVIYTNLFNILQMHGYQYFVNFEAKKTIAQHLQSTNKEIVNITNVKVSLYLYGFIFDRYVEDSKSLADAKVSILEINIPTFNDEKLIDYISRKYKVSNAKEENQYKLLKEYYWVHQLTKPKYTKIMERISPYTDINIYQPNFLQVRASEHFMCPQVTLIKEDHPEYESISAKKGMIGLISHKDHLCRERNYKMGDIIFINDYSPHYRKII